MAVTRRLWSASSFSPGYRVPECRARKWWLVDARGHRVGRLASQIKHLLEGKWKPTYVKGLDCGDFVIVINAKYVQFSGKKWEHKYYTWHTGYPSGLRRMRVTDVLQRKPEQIITRATLGMLRGGRLKDSIAERLRVYPDMEHPHEAQKPTVYFPNKTINDTAWPILEHEEEFELEIENTPEGVKYDAKINKMFTREDRIARYYAKKAGDLSMAKRRQRQMPKRFADQGFVVMHKLEDEQQQSLLRTLRREQYGKYKHLLNVSRAEGEKVISKYEHAPQEWLRQPKEIFFPPRTMNDEWNYDNTYGYLTKAEYAKLKFPLNPLKKYDE